MYDLIIRGGQVVTPGGVGNWDIAIAGEKIALIGDAGPNPHAGRVIDAGRKIVVPGGIEPHTHLNMTMAMEAGHRVRTMGPEVDTIGMAFGGTTTHLDFCFVNPSNDIPGAIARRAAQWKGRSLIDYSFHVALTGALPLATFDQLGDAIADGFPTFKVFTTGILPADPSRRHSMRLDHGRIHWAMGKLARHGGLMTVHAEDDELVQFNYERFIQEGRIDGIHLAQVHSNLSEQLSFTRIIELAAATGAAIYFVHVSAHEGAQAVAAARAGGRPVYAETLHQYACFNAEHYKLPRGFCYHTYPSLKFPEDQAALWDGLVNGGISAAATDEFPTTLEVKLRGSRIDDVTGGNVGAEARMGIIFTEGVVKRGMTLTRFAEVTATNAARIMGLYPRKGAIAPGSDADLCVIDPGMRKVLTREDFHVSDYSPWEGWEVHGWPVMTVLRGKVIVEDGRLGESAGYGQLIPRRIDPLILRRPVV